MFKNWTVVREFNGDVKRLLIAFGLFSFAYLGVVTVVLNLYLLRLGLGIEYIGVISALGQLLWGVGSLPAGIIGRRIGLKRALVAGFLALAIGYCFLLSAEWLPRPLWTPWITASWLFLWLSAGLVTVNSVPYMLLAAGPSAKTHAFAFLSGLVAIMGLIGGLMAGLLPAVIAGVTGWSLDDPTPYRLTLVLTPLAFALSVYCMAGARPLQLEHAQQSDIREGTPLAFFVFFAVILALISAANGGSRAFLNVFLDVGLNVPAPQIGAIIGVAQGLPVVTVIITPHILERLGTTRSLALCGFAMFVGTALLGSSTNWAFAGLAVAAIAMAASVSNTAINLFSQEHVVPAWRTISAAVITIGSAVGLALATGVGGYIIEAAGFRTYFFLLAALVLASVPLLLGFHRRQRAAPGPVSGE